MIGPLQSAAMNSGANPDPSIQPELPEARDGVRSRLRSWAIPKRVLLLSLLVTVFLLAPLAIAYLLAGIPAALALGMGYVALVKPALTLRSHHALALAVPAALAAAVAVGLRGQPFAAAGFVALCCLLVAPANQLREGLMAGLPTAAAVLVAIPGDFDPRWTAGWVLAGGAVVALVATRIPRAAPPAGVEQLRAWRHAIVMAVAVGLVTYLVLALDIRHGYWVAMTLTVVLRPFDDQTRTAAWQRVLGTLAGVVLAVLIAALLPLWAIVAVLAVCMVLMIGYATIGDTIRQVIFLTPTVVLLGSAGDPGLIAAERALATITGAILAGLIALGLVWFETRREAGSEVS